MFLLLRLQGPLQSYGLRASYDQRFTESMPTKSAVIGMLAAALGIERADRASLAELSAMRMLCLCVKEGTQFVDYHTVGAGHVDKRKQLVDADGNIWKSNGEVSSAVTRRQYLVGYRFIVVLEGSNELVNRCERALHDPVHGVFLGRKCCVPSLPIFLAVHKDKASVKEALSAVLDQGQTLETCRAIVEVEVGGQLENDVPVDFEAREFAARRISQDVTEFFV